MKNRMIYILTLCFCLSLTSCETHHNPAPTNPKTQVNAEPEEQDEVAVSSVQSDAAHTPAYYNRGEQAGITFGDTTTFSSVGGLL